MACRACLLAGALLLALATSAADAAAPRRALLRTGKAISAATAGTSGATIPEGGSATASAAVRGGAAASDNGVTKAGADHAWSFSKDGRRLLRTGPILGDAAAQSSAGAAGGSSSAAAAASRDPSASASNGVVSAKASLDWVANEGRRMLHSGPILSSTAAQNSAAAAGDASSSAAAVSHDPSASASNGVVSAKASLDWDANNDVAPGAGRGVGAQSLASGGDVDWSQVAAAQGGSGGNGAGASSSASASTTGGGSAAPPSSP